MSLRQGLIPDLLPDTAWPLFENAKLNASLILLKSKHQRANQSLERLDKLGAQLTDNLNSTDVKTDVQGELRELFSNLKPLADHARNYAESFEEFERCLSDDSNTDVTYANPGMWIELYKRSDDLIKDLTWRPRNRLHSENWK